MLLGIGILTVIIIIVGEILYGWEENRNGKRKK